jgi:DNA-binding LacI/PurR family transcriptional regulator
VAGLWPTLATVEVHPQRVGRLAVEQLSRRITGQFAGAAVEIRVEPAFIPGGSITRPRGGGGKKPPRRPR